MSSLCRSPIAGADVRKEDAVGDDAEERRLVAQRLGPAVFPGDIVTNLSSGCLRAMLAIHSAPRYLT